MGGAKCGRVDRRQRTRAISPDRDDVGHVSKGEWTELEDGWLWTPKAPTFPRPSYGDAPIAIRPFRREWISAIAELAEITASLGFSPNRTRDFDVGQYERLMQAEHTDQWQKEMLRTRKNGQRLQQKELEQGLPITVKKGWWREPEFTMQGDDVPLSLPPPHPHRPDVEVVFYKDIGDKACEESARTYQARVRAAAAERAAQKRKTIKGVEDTPFEDKKKEDGTFMLSMPTAVDLKKNKRIK